MIGLVIGFVIAQSSNVDTSKPYHPLQQVTTDSGTTSVDANNNKVIDLADKSSDSDKLGGKTLTEVINNFGKCTGVFDSQTATPVTLPEGSTSLINIPSGSCIDKPCTIIVYDLAAQTARLSMGATYIQRTAYLNRWIADVWGSTATTFGINNFNYDSAVIMNLPYSLVLKDDTVATLAQGGEQSNTQWAVIGPHNTGSLGIWIDVCG